MLNWLAGLSRERRLALGASAVWILIVTSYGLGYLRVAAQQVGGTAFLDGALFLLALILPQRVCWLISYLNEELRRQREIVSMLADATLPLVDALHTTRTALEASRQTPLNEAIAATSTPSLQTPSRESVAPATPEPAAPVREASAPEAPLQAPEPSPTAEPDRPDDPLPLLPEAAAEATPSWPVFVRALDFPRDENDAEGFAALRQALNHHSVAQMLQAAEDILTMLSEEGVYLEDADIVPSDAGAWRRFIAGARGNDIGRIGGVRDADMLTAARERMRSDPIFRDTALFFQRRFDAMLSKFAREASDEDLMALAQTRSARAFVLLGRLSGTFTER